MGNQSLPKLLIVSFYHPPCNGPAAYRGRWFQKYLPLYGWDSTILASSVYADEIPAEFIPDAKTKLVALPAGKGWKPWALRLTKLEMLVQLRLGLWDHGFFPWSLLAVPAARKLLREDPSYQGILSISPAVSSHWTAYRIHKEFPHLPWIAHFQDPFLGNPFRQSHRWVKPWEQKLEQILFRHADLISANTDTVQELWQGRYPQYKDKFVVTWSGFDPSEPLTARPIPPRPARVLSHVGSVYGGRMPYALFHSLDRLAQAGRLSSKELVVDFLGSTSFDQLGRSDREAMDRLIASGLVRVGKYVARDEALQVIEESDLLLLLDLTHPHNTKLQVPSKVIDYIRVGRPILAFTPQGSPTQRILENSGIPNVIVPVGAPPEQVDAAILDFLKLPSTPHSATPWFHENFDVRPLTKLMVDRFTKLRDGAISTR